MINTSPDIVAPRSTRVGFAPRFVGAIAATAVFLVGCTTQESSPAETVPAVSIAPVPNQYVAPAPTCDTPSNADSKAVAKLFSTTEVIKIDSSTNTEDGLWRDRKRAAKHNGLHIFDPRKTLAPLGEDLYSSSGSTLSTNEYKKVAEEYLRQYGVELVEQQTTDTFNTTTISPIDQTTLSKESQSSYRYSIYELIRNISELPLEFVEQTKLSKVVLAKISDEDVGGFADTESAANGVGIFYMDPTKSLKSHTFNHELSHLWDRRQCNSGQAMFIDKSFVDINPKGVNTYVGNPNYKDPANWPKPYTSYNDVLFSAAAKKVTKQWGDAPVSKSKEYSAKYDALFENVVTAEDYGFANAAEDKATIGEDILRPYAYMEGILDDKSPLLRKKALSLFARMWQDDPRIVKYFEEVGNKTF